MSPARSRPEPPYQTLINLYLIDCKNNNRKLGISSKEDDFEGDVPFHKIKTVLPLKDYCLLVQLCAGVTKIYDVKPLFDWKDIFKKLKENELFYEVYVDVAGYGVVWNDEIDISSEELWENGVDIESIINK